MALNILDDDDDGGDDEDNDGSDDDDYDDDDDDDGGAPPKELPPEVQKCLITDGKDVINIIYYRIWPTGKIWTNMTKSEHTWQYLNTHKKSEQVWQDLITDGKDVQTDLVAEKLWGEILERTARFFSQMLE